MSDVKHVYLPIGEPDRFGWLRVEEHTLTALDRNLLHHLASWNVNRDEEPAPQVKQLVGDYLRKKPGEKEAQAFNPEIVSMERQMASLYKERRDINNEIAALSEQIEELFDQLTEKGSMCDAIHVKIRRAYRNHSMRNK